MKIIIAFFDGFYKGFRKQMIVEFDLAKFIGSVIETGIILLAWEWWHGRL